MVDALIQIIEEKIVQAAIPIKKVNNQRSPLPWWSDECREAVTTRVRSERALRRHYTIENKICYNRAKARCKYLCNQARKKSWEIFLGTINQNTTLHKVWKKVQ